MTTPQAPREREFFSLETTTEAVFHDVAREQGRALTLHRRALAGISKL